MANHKHIALSLLVVGAGLIGAYTAYSNWKDSATRTATSDSAHIRKTLRVGVDGWVGYFPLCSPEMQKRLHRDGLRLECIDDAGDYAGRYSALSAGKLDLAVGTVDSYLSHGNEVNWGGSIIAVIDESKGGDAVVAYDDEVASLDDLKAEGIKVALTPNSPSHQLLKSLSVHFDIERLRQNDRWATFVDGSSEALNALKRKQVAAAVLWEPDVSKALEIPGVKRLIGTESTENLIVDVLIANRAFALQEPDIARSLLNAYFRTLRYYRANMGQLYSDLSDWTDLDEKTNEELVKGVAWAGLYANASNWMGLTDALSDIGLIDAIQSTRETLAAFSGEAPLSLPDNDPFRIIYSTPIKQLHDIVEKTGDLDEPGTVAHQFAALSDSDWDRLETVGTLKIEPVSFVSGSNALTDDGQQLLDKAIKTLKHYPTFRVLVAGHTTAQGDPKANLELSVSRADAVTQYLATAYQVQPTRLKAAGFGGAKPLARKPGESLRAYRYRLPRVELILKRAPL